MSKIKNDDDKTEKDIDKIKQLQEMRKELARNMGTSNYFFYLESNINSSVSRGA